MERGGHALYCDIAVMAAACSMIISMTFCQPSVFTSTPACAATPWIPSHTLPSRLRTLKLWRVEMLRIHHHMVFMAKVWFVMRPMEACQPSLHTSLPAGVRPPLNYLCKTSSNAHS